MSFSVMMRGLAVAATVLATVLGPTTPAQAATTAAKRCETPGGHPNTHVCIRYKRDGDGHHWARATIRNDRYPGDGPVDIVWVRLLRFDCGTGQWKVVRKKEGSHTYQAYEATLTTGKYTDFYSAVRWRAVASWVIQERHGTLSGEIRTRPVGSCEL
ncbi:MAG TPA: hypothetical protein VFT00_03050 [Nocardioides sp.]|nr:hypothetical protein [Nocardioides sp.]